MAGVSSQGTYLSFSGSTYTATRITVNDGSSDSAAAASQQRQRVSVATLASDPNGYEPFIPVWQPDPTGQGGGPGDERTKSVEVDFIGTTQPSAGSSGTVAITGRISFSGAATCTGSSLTASLGDIVRGSASFRVKV